MQLKFERALERKLPVAVASMGEVAPGYQLVKLEVEPRRMDVIGPISLMRTLTELSTEPLDLTGLSVDSRMKVGLELPAGVKLASGSTVDVLVDLEEQLSSRRLEAVQVKAGNYQPQSPVSLVLSGPVSVMEELDPSEVWVVVAVPEGLSSRQLKATPGIGPGLHYKVELPPGLKLEKVEPERIVLVPIKE
jgi:YbbR domain-containing protein